MCRYVVFVYVCMFLILIYRLKISQKQTWAARCVMPVSVVSGFDEVVPESEHSVDSNNSAQVYFCGDKS